MTNVSIVLEPVIKTGNKKGQYDLVGFTDYVEKLYGENWFTENEPKKEKKFKISKRRYIRHEDEDSDSYWKRSSIRF